MLTRDKNATYLGRLHGLLRWFKLTNASVYGYNNYIQEQLTDVQWTLHLSTVCYILAAAYLVIYT